MLAIMRNFRLGFPIDRTNEIEAKLKELKIHITRTMEPYRYEFEGEHRIKLYMECFGQEENLLALMDYLTNEFSGIASVTY